MILYFLKCSDAHIWLKLRHECFDFENDLYLCLCYVVPSNSSRQGVIETNVFDEILLNITHIKHVTENACNFLITGDFNSRIGQECDYVTNDSNLHVNVLPDDYVCDQEIPRKSQDTIVNLNGYLLLDFLKQSGLRIANGRVCEDKNVGAFTYVGARGSSLVDYCIVNPEILSEFLSFYIHDPHILSDHCLVEFSLSFNYTFETEDNSGDDSSGFTHFKWDNAHKEEYKIALNSEDVKDCLSALASDVYDASCENDINSSISSFSDVIDSVCIPLFQRNTKPHKSNSCSQMNNRNNFNIICAEKRKAFYRHLDAFRRNKNAENRQNMITSRSKYKKAVKQFNFDGDQQKSRKLLNAKFKNAKEYWRLLKESVSKTKPKKLSATDFEDYFRAINNPDDHFFQPDNDIIDFNERFLNSEIQVMFDELNTVITEEEIRKAIFQLKNGRSGGPDKLLNEFFIYGVNELLPYLYNLFNRILDSGYFPDSWSEGYIVPLHKKGKLDDVNNFRGITLLSTLGKLFFRILNNRLTLWAEEYFVYIEAQAGFRAGMSTVDNVFVLHGIINHLLSKGEKKFLRFCRLHQSF